MTHSPSLFTPDDIISLRSLARLSQTELAEALHYDQTTICKWERGHSPMLPHAYVPFLDVIMARFALLGYVTEQKYQMYQATIIHRSYSPLPSAITVP